MEKNPYKPHVVLDNDSYQAMYHLKGLLIRRDGIARRNYQVLDLALRQMIQQVEAELGERK